MPERRHYRIHIGNAGEAAKRFASGIGDTVAERLDHLRDHNPNSRVVRNVAIGVGAGAAAVVGGREVLRRIKKRREAQPNKDKVDGANSGIKQPDPAPKPVKEKEADSDIYGVKLPTISLELMSWIDDTDNVRGSEKDVPRYVVDFLGDVNGADVNDVEESLREAIRKRERLFGAYFREVNGRVVEDVKRRGFEVDSGLDSPLGEFENYSPAHARKSLIRELGYQAEQTPDEFAANIKSEIDCLEMSHIRQSALPALEKFRTARGMSTFAEIAEMGPRDLSGKDLVKLNLISAQDAEAYKNNKQDVSEEEPTIDEYAKRVKDLIEAAEKLERDLGPIKSFDELRDFEDKILAARIDSSDCLDEVYTSLRNGGEFISDDLIRRERERTNPPIPVPTRTPTREDDSQRQGNRCSTTKKLALAFAAGAALVGGAWVSHELTEDNGGNTTSLSYNIDLSHHSLNALPGSNVDHVVQGNNYLGNNGGESRLGNSNGGAKQGTEQAPSNGAGKDVTPNGKGVEDGKQRSGSLTPAEAKDYIDNLDGQKDGKLRVVISKADGSGGIDTLDWALARTLKTDKFNSQNPSINGVSRWQDTSAAIADQGGKTAEDFHWVNDKQVVDLTVGDHMAKAFIDANVPLVKSAPAPQASGQSATPDNGGSKGTQTPDASKTPTKTPSATATGTATQTPTMAPTRTPAVDVMTNTPTPTITETPTVTETPTASATGTPVNEMHSYSAYSEREPDQHLICTDPAGDEHPTWVDFTKVTWETDGHNVTFRETLVGDPTGQNTKLKPDTAHAIVFVDPVTHEGKYYAYAFGGQKDGDVGVQVRKFSRPISGFDNIDIHSIPNPGARDDEIIYQAGPDAVFTTENQVAYTISQEVFNRVSNGTKMEPWTTEGTGHGNEVKKADGIQDFNKDHCGEKEKTPTATVTSTATSTSTEIPTNTATSTEVPATVTMTPIPTSTEVPPTVISTATATSTGVPSTSTATEVPPVIVIKSATPTSTEVPASPTPTSTATAPVEVPASPTVVVKSGPRIGFGGNRNEDPDWMAFAAAMLGAAGAATLYKGMKFGRLPLFSDDEEEGILARKIITDRKERKEK